MPFRLSHSL